MSNPTKPVRRGPTDYNKWDKYVAELKLEDDADDAKADEPAMDKERRYKQTMKEYEESVKKIAELESRQGATRVRLEEAQANYRTVLIGAAVVIALSAIAFYLLS